MVNLGQALSWLAALVFPPACPLCCNTFPKGWQDLFCRTCLRGFLPLPAARCPRCALPFDGSSASGHLCGRCAQKTPPFSSVHAVGLFEQSLRQALHQFKFHQRVGLDRPLGQLLLRQFNTDQQFDLIVPVPLNSRRLKERSYNQSLLLAREIGRGLRIPVAVHLLQREQDTESQRKLSAHEREKNMRGAFQLRGSLAGEKILLVDDVMTTGATVSACSGELIRGGAGEVQVAVIGRAAIL